MTEKKAAPHPITLHKLFFTRSIVTAVPDHEPNLGSVLEGADNHLNCNPIKDRPGFYNAGMHSILNTAADKIHPYVIDMQVIGEFHADDTLDEPAALRAVYITAHGVLYGAIREAVSWITARQPYGPLLLGLSVLQSAAPIAAAEAQPDLMPTERT